MRPVLRVLNSHPGIQGTPEPGVYAGVPFDTYHAWDACSSSRLGRLARSPAHLRAYLDGQVDDETAAKTSGRLLHTAVLEPERFRTTVVRGPEGDGRTKAVRDARVALEAAGKTVVAPAEYNRIIAMRDRLLAHATVQQLLERAFSPTELSIVWDADGLLCKARLDLPIPSLGTILDIKTARDARPSEFAKAVFNFGYARQAAHYLNGTAVHWPATFDLFVYVVVESEPPHEVAVYELDADALELARREVDMLRARYRACIETGEWPGYDVDVQRIGLPAWGRGTHERHHPLNRTKESVTMRKRFTKAEWDDLWLKIGVWGGNIAMVVLAIFLAAETGEWGILWGLWFAWMPASMLGIVFGVAGGFITWPLTPWGARYRKARRLRARRAEQRADRERLEAQLVTADRQLYALDPEYASGLGIRDTSVQRGAQGCTPNRDDAPAAPSAVVDWRKGLALCVSPNFT